MSHHAPFNAVFVFDMIYISISTTEHIYKVNIV